MIDELDVGRKLEGFFVLRSAALRTTAAGKPFLTAVLGDRSGEMDAVAWDYSGPIGPGDEGAVVKVRGGVSEYRGSLQIGMDRIRLAVPSDVYRVEELVPVAPMDRAAAWREIGALVESLTDKDYLAVCREELERHGAAFQTAPAAKSVHHSFVGGLMMHTLNMLRMAEAAAALYADTVNRDLLLTATLLHDMAKLREFTFSPLGLVTGYSLRGDLMGHLVMGAEEIGEICRERNVPEEKTVLLQHLILSHHGAPEFGAAVAPQCAEAELLYHLDMIDSRMEICREALAQTYMGEFTDRIYALEQKRMYRHPLTAETPAQPE